jgi:hypothetical protein
VTATVGVTTTILVDPPPSSTPASIPVNIVTDIVTDNVIVTTTVAGKPPGMMG